MKRYIKPASEPIDLEMGVMIAASDTNPELDNAEDKKEDASGGRSPIWRHMDNDGNEPLF